MISNPMKIKLDVSNESGIDCDLPRLDRIAEQIAEQEQVAGIYEISLLLVDDLKMAQLNQTYRGKSGPTDVLSFAVESPSNQPETGLRTYLCDIVIDINYILRQKGSNNFRTEFGIVFIHAILHLLGYDHIKKNDKELMESKEQYYLETLRELI